MFKSIGTIRYFDNPYKLIIEIDQGISDYYRSMIPKYIRTQPQKYKAHISVVRKEIPVNLEFWGKYEGEEVEFFYENIVRAGEVYCWLNVFCKRAEEVRLELGLPVSSEYTLPPAGFDKCFHSTLCNFKNEKKVTPQ